MIFEVEEENILLESKNTMFLFSIDYVNHVFFVDVFDKKSEEYIVTDFEITDPDTKKSIYNTIDRKPGTTFRKGDMKFLVRNHDRVIWCDEIDYGKKIAGNYISDDSIYDTRNNSNTIVSKIMPFLKEAWLKI